MISGPPGTGKTSTIKCLANETNRHIFNINLNNDITKAQIENIFFNETVSVVNTFTGMFESYSIPIEQRIYVLEDVDCQGDLVKDRSSNDLVENKPPNDLLYEKCNQRLEPRPKALFNPIGEVSQLNYQAPYEENKNGHGHYMPYLKTENKIENKIENKTDKSAIRSEERRVGKEC